MAGFFGKGSEQGFFGSGGESSTSFQKRKKAQAEAMAEYQDEEEMARQLAGNQDDPNADKRDFFSKAFDMVNVADSGRSWGRATPSDVGAKKSGAQQFKEAATGFFSGIEKTGDAVEGLTGIAARRMQHWDRQLAEGKISQSTYETLIKAAVEDTKWAGTENKGTADRLKKSAGVSLEATSEIVPFMKAGKAAQLTTKGGAAFGAATGAAHGVGSQLTNPEGFDAKAALIETAVGTAGGALGGKLSQWNRVRNSAQVVPAIDEEIATAVKSGSVAKVKKLQKQKDYIAQEIIADDTRTASEARLGAVRPDVSDVDQGSAMGERKVSRLAERSEEKAIRNKLVESFGELPTYESTNLDDEAAMVATHMKNDLDGAVRVALGIDTPPPGTTAGSYYVGLSNRAARTGDDNLARRLATEGVVSQRASRMGQEISALQRLDPESPVTAMRNVLKARSGANPKLPATITDAEAKQITDLSKNVLSAREALETGSLTPEARTAYGQARIAYDNYVADLIAGSGPKLGEALKKPGFYKDTIMKTAGMSKSLVATLDNSVIFRQGWKTMFSHPKTWAKNSLKSFGDIVNSIGGKDVLDHVHADIVSRDNALNGLYKQMGLDVYGAKKNFMEEAFPVSIGKNWKKGNPFKASEAAFSGWQQRTRADLADQYLVLAKDMGIDLTSKKELQSIGKLVNSLTSRGHLGKAEKWADGLNKLFFAPRLIKSHIDVLGGHVVTGAGGSDFVRKQAAKNLLRISIGSAVALKLASEVTGGKLEVDPRSSDFGKVRVGDTRFDLSGGMAGLLTLGTRLLPTPGDDGWGFHTKSSNTGETKKLNSGENGAQTALDVLYDFGENKLAPLFAAASDVYEGRDFDGNKPTVGSVTRSLTMPLIIQNYQELQKDPNRANVAASMIAEGLGISANTYSLDSNWNSDNGKTVQGFKAAVSKEKFDEANQKFNQEYQSWYSAASDSDLFWKLPIDKRETLTQTKKTQLMKDVMKAYGYKYEREKTPDDTQALIDTLKNF